MQERKERGMKINLIKIMTKPRVGIKTGIDKLWNFSYKI